MGNKYIYLVHNGDIIQISFALESDAEEYILSMTQETEYREFCIKGPEQYFKDLDFYMDFHYAEDCKTYEGYSLWRASYGYDIIKVKFFGE